ncbi:tRNA dimethylallyltransferase 2-like protein, partial [Drosera capensis]
KRRISRLRALFSWNINFVDSTESLCSNSDHTWFTDVLKPSVQLVGSFLKDEITSVLNHEFHGGHNIAQKDLWTQHVCEACGHKILRGEHEWKQHRQGRSHRKRVSSLKNLVSDSKESQLTITRRR